MVTTREVVDAITERQMQGFYQRFSQTAADHEFHRTEVKKGLLALFTELVGEADGYAEAKNYITKHPYEKEHYWRLVFRNMVVFYGYRHCELHTINCAITARIMYEQIMAKL